MSREVEDGMGFAGLVPTAADKVEEQLRGEIDRMRDRAAIREAEIERLRDENRRLKADLLAARR